MAPCRGKGKRGETLGSTSGFYKAEAGLPVTPMCEDDWFAIFEPSLSDEHGVVTGDGNTLTVPNGTPSSQRARRSTHTSSFRGVDSTTTATAHTERIFSRHRFFLTVGSPSPWVLSHIRFAHAVLQHGYRMAFGGLGTSVNPTLVRLTDTSVRPTYCGSTVPSHQLLLSLQFPVLTGLVQGTRVPC
jgi:hypothetical protein